MSMKKDLTPWLSLINISICLIQIVIIPFLIIFSIYSIEKDYSHSPYVSICILV
jgi:hypothetical protein